MGNVRRPPANPVVVAEALRGAIVKGDVVAGERLKEIPLANELGISRGPIREAFRLLAAEGLLTILPNRGAVVPEVHADDVLEVYALRASIGSLALHKLMLGGDGDTAKPAILRALGGIKKAVAQGNDRMAADADLAFQEVIIRSAELSRVTRIFENLTWQIRMFIAILDISYVDQFPQMLKELESLCEAIVGDDEELAERIWREKFERWVEHFVDHLPGEEFDRDLWLRLTGGHA